MCRNKCILTSIPTYFWTTDFDVIRGGSFGFCALLAGGTGPFSPAGACPMVLQIPLYQCNETDPSSTNSRSALFFHLVGWDNDVICVGPQPSECVDPAQALGGSWARIGAKQQRSRWQQLFGPMPPTTPCWHLLIIRYPSCRMLGKVV